MGKDITRRELAILLGSVPAAVETSLAWQKEQQKDPLTNARSEVRKAIEEMEKFDLSMFTEPAFVFKP